MYGAVVPGGANGEEECRDDVSPTSTCPGADRVNTRPFSCLHHIEVGAAECDCEPLEFVVVHEER